MEDRALLLSEAPSVAFVDGHAQLTIYVDEGLIRLRMQPGLAWELGIGLLNVDNIDPSALIPYAEITRSELRPGEGDKRGLLEFVLRHKRVVRFQIGRQEAATLRDALDYAVTKWGS